MRKIREALWGLWAPIRWANPIVWYIGAAIVCGAALIALLTR